MDNKHSLTLQLTLEEINVVLDALGQQPYVKVFGVIQKIQQQAGAQINQSNGQGRSGESKEAHIKEKTS